MHAGITAILINYNTRDMLAGCLKSLSAQTHKNIKVIFIDNDSQDGSCDFIQEHFPQVTAVCNSVNLGYAKAANQGIKMSETPYVMILNADIRFEPDYIEKCLKKMEEDKKIAAIAGKIYRYDFKNEEKTKTIDTAGLFCFRNRRIIDNGQGLEDKGQFDQEQEVFGISGCCPIYRREALDNVRVFGEYLDGDFFMYKEDVDLSWRFLLFGWKNYYLPSAVTYHGRGTGVLKRFSHWEVAKNRSQLSHFTKYYSFKNQRLMQVKNELWGNYLKNIIPIFIKDLLIAGYVLFREPYLVKAWFHALRQLPNALRKRAYIMKNKKVTWKEMDRWLNHKNSPYHEATPHA